MGEYTSTIYGSSFIIALSNLEIAWFFLGVSEKGRGKIERGGFFGDFISIVLIFYCSSGKKANGILRYIFSITNERSKQHEESCTNT